MKNRNKVSLLFISAIFTIATFFSSPSFSATPPTPVGYYTGGLFSQYFRNMVQSGGANPSGVCPAGQSIVGFSTGTSTYARPVCRAVTSGGYWTQSGGTDLYYTGGKVSIGKNTASATLDISGSVAANTYYFNIGGSTLSGGYDTQFSWTWWGNNITNTNTGNVGINRLTPGYSLDVSGSLNVGTAGDFTINNKYFSYKPGGIACVNDQILAWSGTLSPVPGWACTSDSAGITSVGLTTNRITKWNGTKLVDSLIYDNGTSLSIGTAVPTERLTVSGGNIGINRTSADYSILSITNAGGAQVHLNANRNSEGNLRTVTNHPLSFSTNNTEKMRIDTAGNVGIGTNSPNSLLTLSGGINNGLRINNGTMNGVVFNTSNTSMSVGTVSNHPLSFITNNTSQVTISTGGSVGIGIALPTNLLHLSSATQYKGLTISNGTYNNAFLGGFSATNDEGGLVLYRAGATKVQILANGPSFLSGGNVGIGTSSPSGKLDVAGSFYSQAGGMVLRDQGVANEGGELFFNGQGTNNGILVDNQSGNFRIYTSSAPANKDLFLANFGTAFVMGLNVQGNVTAAGFFNSSDKSLKKNLTPIKNSLSRLLKLNGYSFEWKKDGKRDMGVVAQEVEEVFPEIVSTNHDTGLKTVEYGNLTAPIIEAIREQQNQINNQQKEIEALKQQIEALAITK